MRPIFLFLFSFSISCTVHSQSTKTISVKKAIKISEVRLDPTFTKLLVYDQLHTEMDSCIVSFEMRVEVPVPDIYYGAPGGPIYKVKTPIIYKTNSSYLSEEMRTAWAKVAKGDQIKFQNIYIKAGDQKQIRWRDFILKKP